MSDYHGIHVVFPDYSTGVQRLVGVSKAADRGTWDAQIAALFPTNAPVPSYVAPSGLEYAGAGDFGATLDFKYLAFMAKTPIDMKVEIDAIGIPLKPRCLPSFPQQGSLREQDVITIPPQPTLSVATNLAEVLASPSENVEIKSTCNNPPQFVLGGDGSKAVQSSNDTALAQVYGYTLQAWQGPDYTTTSSSLLPATLALSQHFAFNPGDDMTTVSLTPGSLVANRSSYVFFVVVPDAGTDFYIQGVGGGNALWQTNGDGVFSQYVPPWTLPPGAGIVVPVYYNGVLRLDPTYASSTLGVPTASSTLASSTLATTTTTSSTPEGASGPESMVATQMVPLTLSSSDSKHPRMAIDKRDNLWAAFYSDRTGNDEVYICKYFGAYGQWDSSAQGGSETRLTNAGANGAVARCPSVAVGPNGEVHVVWQSNDTEDGNFDIFYCESQAGGTAFLPPERVSSSPATAVMPDVVVTTEDGQEKVVVVWHDDRFGSYEIMSAVKMNGAWQSSGSGGSDIRLTSSPGDSLFPRIAADPVGNLRVAYQDNRLGSDRTNVYMARFDTGKGIWDSSGQGGTDSMVSSGAKNSLHPDLDIDGGAGVQVVWHDDREQLVDPTKRENLYGAYCSNYSANAGNVSCLPVISGEYTKMDVSMKVVDCQTYQEISVTTIPDVCVVVTAPGATYIRMANEDQQYTGWQAFGASTDLDTVVVPWRLTCNNGKKQICVQVQDSQFVGIPICREVTLQSSLPRFDIEFYQDEALSVPLLDFQGKPVAPRGDIFLKVTPSVPLSSIPTFDVVSKGLRSISNQGMLLFSGFSGVSVAMSGVSGVSGLSGLSGLQSFLGTSGLSGFSPVSSSYVGRFSVRKDDGFFFKDGPARIVMHGSDTYGNSF